MAVRILLVEDCDADAFLTRRALDDTHLATSIQRAETLESAVRQLDSEQYDAILLDLGLPGAQGVSAVESVREHAPAVPLLVLSGETRADIGARACAAGADDFISKDDLEAAVLRSALERTLGNREGNGAGHTAKPNTTEPEIPLEPADRETNPGPSAHYSAAEADRALAPVDAKHTPDSRWLAPSTLLATLAAVAVLAFDLTTERGIAAAVPYVLVVWIASFSKRTPAVWIAAIACAVLTVFGGVMSPLGGEAWKVLANRGIALSAIGLTAVLCVRDLHAIEELAAAHLTASRLAAIVEDSRDAIVGVSLDGVVTSWNRGATALFGYTEQEMRGAPLARLGPTSGPDRAEGGLQAVRRGSPTETIEAYRLKKDGSDVAVSETVSPVRDSAGRPVGASVIARDISERKRWEARERAHARNMSRVNAALEQSNMELAQFAYVASHDLQAPLRAIAGFAQLLRKDYYGQLDEQADSYLDHVVLGAKRLQGLINAILSYSRVESRATPFTPVHLEDVLAEVVTVLGPSIDELGATVEGDSLPTVVGDRAQLSQLLQNLIGNGLKYHGDDPAHVRVTAEREGALWTIGVTDNGRGIEQRHLERIFEIFRRLHRDEDQPGSGIGLAICRRIVHRHGGRIWVESEPGLGSTFYFTIPVQASPERATEERIHADHDQTGNPADRVGLRDG